MPPEKMFWVCFEGPNTFSGGVWMSREVARSQVKVPKAGKGNDAISTRDFFHDLANNPIVGGEYRNCVPAMRLI